MNNESKLKKNISLLIVLTVSAAVIYMLPYLRYFYYEAFRDAFSMTDGQTAMAGTYYGILGAMSYLIGGLISDRVSIRILIPGSLIVTGALGLVLLTTPSPFVIAIIHGVWGITSLMTFWPALIKALRMVGNSNEQGKVFGLFEGGRGVTNAAVYAIAAAIFGALYVAGNELSGILPIITLYSSLSIALGLASIYLLRSVKEEKSEKTEAGINFVMIGQVLKNPYVWLISVIIFCTYFINMTNYYIAPYASVAFSVSLLAAGIMSSSSQYIRPFAAIGAGFLGDRINASKVMLIGLFITLLGLITILVVPVGSTISPIIIGLGLVFVSMYVTQSMHFAIMEETSFPKEATGTVIGLCCTIGYLPEAISPYVAGKILDSNLSQIDAYRLIFMIMIGVTLLGIVFTLIWLKLTQKRRGEILEMKKQKHKVQ